MANGWTGALMSELFADNIIMAGMGSSGMSRIAPFEENSIVVGDCLEVMR